MFQADLQAKLDGFLFNVPWALAAQANNGIME
jgi:hypothetical protein